MSSFCCRKCGVDHPLSSFYVSKSNKTGHSYHCIACVATYQRARRGIIREQEKKRYVDSELVRRDKILRARAYRKANASRVRAGWNTWEQDNPDKVKAAKNRWYVEHKDEAYRKHLMHSYACTPQTYAGILEKQSGACAICRIHFDIVQQRNIHLDHCHATGRIRGVLCSHCNHLLGHAFDKTSTLSSAIRYLTAHAHP